ncbi:MAG: 2,3-bisphosphoglycerate-independent phosphoglycerate mutase [Phycisphaerae bacterium]|nr:2,3-bisphosphoglycerate-independent phosphoglycerate mutase [Phycisphaerae bacterium]
MNKPLMLLIRDGWGIGSGDKGDAIAAAKTPCTDSLLSKYPNCRLQASGEGVGVRPGSQGSSEVGHLNMGAGRIVEQEVVRVDKLISTGELFENPLFVQAVKSCKTNGKKFHLMGLVQNEGVHAMHEHLFAFLKVLGAAGVKDVCIHFFTDGRDTPPQSALTYLDELEAKITEYKVGRVATVIGRYWAMDRAENWDRTEKAYRAMVNGEGLKARSAREAIEQAYKRAETQLAAGDDIVENDEFISPTIIVDDSDKPVGLIESGDAVLHFNYRQDRALQTTLAFVEDNFAKFNRGPQLDINYMGLTRYYDEFELGLAAPMNMSQLLGEILAANKLKQLRIAEFQKFRHVTSFFNGKIIEPFPGEDRIMVDSIKIPENQKPEMSAYEVTDLVLTAVNDGVSAVREKTKTTDVATLELPGSDSDASDDTYDVIVLNYANCDMVGHTGVFDAAVKAVETVDECTAKVIDAVLARDGVVLVTADHGNAEQMTNPETGDTHTAHTTLDVEFILVANDADKYQLAESGILANIAPTMLQLLGIEKPAEMTAKSLIE